MSLEARKPETEMVEKNVLKKIVSGRRYRSKTIKNMPNTSNLTPMLLVKKFVRVTQHNNKRLKVLHRIYMIMQFQTPKLTNFKQPHGREHAEVVKFSTE